MVELAPTGKLRSAHNVGNAVLATRDASGRLQGITVDLAQAMAREGGLALEPLAYPNVAALFEALARGEVDILFLADDPTRAGQVDFAGIYMEVSVTYIVPSDSPIRSVDDVDRPGVRIAVGAKNAADLHLTRSLKSAELLRGPSTAPYLAEMMSSRKADAAAGNIQELAQVQRSIPGLRIVEGRFATIKHAIALPKGRPRAFAFVRAFVENAKASGLVQAAIARSGTAGVTVAAP